MSKTRASADDWKAFAKTYAELTRGTTASPIELILKRLNDLLPFTEATGFLDNGCGPGTIMSRLLRDYGVKLAPSSHLTCSDWAPAMIDQVKNVKNDAVKEDPNSQWARVRIEQLDAMDLKDIQDGSQSHVAAGWVFYSTADPQRCLAESKRVLQENGVLAVSSWQEIEWLRVQRPLRKLRPDTKAPCLPEGWDSASALKGELVKAGFRDVETHEVPVQVTYESYDIFTDVLLTKVPHIVARTSDFSDEERVTLKNMMIEEMKAICPTEPGTLKGRAIVGLGRK